MLSLLLLFAGPALADEPTPVQAQIDWQGHPAMHIPWPMFGRGLLDRERRARHRHQFRQVVTTPALDASGVRIHLFAAMAAERAANPRQATRLIHKQLDYVEAWVGEHGDRYALATSPAQAREILEKTDKAVVIHSIEGGREILDTQAEIEAWRDRGVALMTVTHLFDDGLGGAAINPEPIGKFINPKAAGKRRRGEARGLTPRGREVIVELADAGILVDLTHMSPQSVAESLAITREHGIPPVVTHGMLTRLGETERAFSDAQVVDIYQQGGLFALPLAGQALEPHDRALPDGHCPMTLDAFTLHWQALRTVLAENQASILGRDTSDGPLSESEQIRLASGWSSDWNGWTSHSPPKYGKGRCVTDPPADALAIDTVGLAHPGLLPQHWQRVEEAGVDLQPMLWSAERFLQLWEQVDARR